jgi:hypothetical protein
MLNNILTISSEIIGIIGFIVSFQKKLYRLLALFAVIFVFGVVSMVYGFLESKSQDGGGIIVSGTIENSFSQTDDTTEPPDTSVPASNPLTSESATNVPADGSSTNMAGGGIGEVPTGNATEDRMNFLDITVNGDKKTYNMRDDCIILDNGRWLFDFYSSKHEINDNFSFTVPIDVESGESKKLVPFVVDPNGFLPTIDYAYSFFYTTPKGSYLFVDDMGDGSEVNIIIDKWEGRGRIAEGRINGVFYINEIDKFTFDDGYFKTRIQDSPY